MKTRLLFAVVVSFSLFVPAAALGADWEGAFSPETLEEKLDPKERQFMVVVPGGDEESDRAATDFTRALRETPVQMVMGDDALGDVSEASDGEIVEKTKGKPVDRVAIVRVFPGGEGQSSRAVVTVYDRKKEVVSAITANPSDAAGDDEEGSTEEKDSKPEASRGVSEEASEALSEVQKKAEEDLEARREKFLKKFLGLQETAYVDASSGRTVLQKVDFFRGKYKEEISDEKFYELVADGKYLDEYRARRTRKTVLLAVGWPTSIGGILMLTSGLFTLSSKGINKPLMYAGGGLWAAGSIAILWGSNISPHPVEMSEIRRLTDEYNKGLKEDLNLSSGYRPTTSKKKGAMDFNFGLSLSPDGGMGTMQLRF